MAAKFWNGLSASLAALAVILMTAVSAQAQDDESYADLSGSEIVALLEAHGYSASLTTDSAGDPLVMASADGLRFRVQTYDCNSSAPRRCRTLQMVSSFALERPPSAEDFIAMNDYNNQKVYGRAYIDDNGDAAVDFTVNLSGGVSASNLMDNVGTWKAFILDVFVNYLGWQVS